MAGIELIIGPMFSGKTTEMINRCRFAALSDQPTLLIKYKGDSRYAEGDIVTSHSDIHQISTSKSRISAEIRVVSAQTLSEVDNVTEMVIGIDEGQFYPDLLECCEKWVDSGKRIIVAALDGDFMRRPFGQVCELIPKCEYVKKKYGICMVCRRSRSSFTKRTTDSTELVVVGAQESYKAVCRTCY